MTFFGILALEKETCGPVLAVLETFIRSLPEGDSLYNRYDISGKTFVYMDKRANRLVESDSRTYLGFFNKQLNASNTEGIDWSDINSVLDKLIGGFFFIRYGPSGLSVYCDPNGIQQIYYLEKDGYLVLSDDLKLLASWPGYRKELNLPAVDSFISSETNSFAETFFKGIFRIEPGEKIELCGTGLKTGKYWDLVFPEEKTKAGLPETVEALNLSFFQVMQRYLANRNPDYALMLSGGIDSNFILAMLVRAGSGPVKTFTIGYGSEEQYYSDEIPGARISSKHFRTDHEEVLFSRNDFEEVLFGDYTRIMDEPNGNIANLALVFTKRRMAGRINNVLTGLGPDTFFYSNPNDFRYHRLYSLLKFLDSTGAGRVLEFLKTELSRMAPFDYRLNRVFFTRRGYIRGVKTKSEFNQYIKYKLYSPLMLEVKRKTELIYDELVENHLKAVGERTEISDKMAYVDLKMVILRNFVNSSCQIFQRSMIEYYVPYLDPAFMNEYAKVAEKNKFFSGRRKMLEVLMAEKYLPPEILFRKKQPFRVPHIRWINETFKEKMIQRALAGRTVDALFKRGALKHYLRSEHSALLLWRLFLLEKWTDENF